MNTHVTIQIFEDMPSLAKELAALFLQKAEEAIRARGRFVVALSGGSTPKAFYPELRAAGASFAWENVFFFFVDERLVPFDDPENNARMTFEHFFEPLDVPNENIFRIDTTKDVETAASDYEKRIAGFFQGRRAVFDFVFLGLGADAHTASLFPDSPALKVREAGVKAVKDTPVERVTMTAAMINQARTVAFLVVGNTKAQAVKQVLKPAEMDEDRYPAQAIRPRNGELYWFMDANAGRKI